MRQIVTQGVVLSRTDFGEADRILTILTPDQGKLRLMAKGVRRIKSKLAGGIELFSVSDITYLPGRKDIGTLISSRLSVHYGNIAHDIDRTMMAYAVLRRLHRATEDSTDQQYFSLVVACFAALNDNTSCDVVDTWFLMQLLKLDGHVPNFHSTSQQQPLTSGTRYNFDYDSMSLVPHEKGLLSSNDIKLLRLLVQVDDPRKLVVIEGIGDRIVPLRRFVTSMASVHVRE